MYKEELYVTKNGLIDWIKAHRKQMILAGVSITAIIGVVLGLKNRKAINEFWNTLMMTMSKKSALKGSAEITPKTIENVIPETTKAEVIDYAVPRKAYSSQVNVSKHVRNLPAGMHPSAKKLAEATENGFDLVPGQTWVDAYVKGSTAA